MPDTTKFMDPSMMFSSTWPLRTAMIQRRDYKWEVVEHSVPYYTQLKYASEIIARSRSARVSRLLF